MKNTYLFIALLLSSFCVAQNNQSTTLLLNFNYGINAPAADLKTRFGASKTTGVGIEIMTAEKNWIFGSDLAYIFGKDVKENPLAGLYNYEEFIYGNDFAPSPVFLRERGYFIELYTGKLFSLKKQKRSGIRTTFGAGYTQHWIRLQDDSRAILQIQGEARKGYDRRTGGFFTHQFIGYQLLSQNRRINFTLGLECMQGFTKSQRSWDWDKKSQDTDNRLDLLYGLKASWILPFYIGDNGETKDY